MTGTGPVSPVLSAEPRSQPGKQRRTPVSEGCVCWVSLHLLPVLSLEASQILCASGPFQEECRRHFFAAMNPQQNRTGGRKRRAAVQIELTQEG